MKDLAAAGHQAEDDSSVPPASRPDATVATLFKEYAAFVASFLYRLGVEPADVDDQVQEVFVIAHRKGGYRSGEATPRTWLGAIAVRVASHYRRSRRRRREDIDETALAAAASIGRSPEEAASAAQGLSRVQRALESLDVGHRAVFLLYELEGESCQDIAASLGIPVGTVYSRLHHARRAFTQAHSELLEENP